MQQRAWPISHVYIYIYDHIYIYYYKLYIYISHILIDILIDVFLRSMAKLAALF